MTYKNLGERRYALLKYIFSQLVSHTSVGFSGTKITLGKQRSYQRGERLGGRFSNDMIKTYINRELSERGKKKKSLSYLRLCQVQSLVL